MWYLIMIGFLMVLTPVGMFWMYLIQQGSGNLSDDIEMELINWRSSLGMDAVVGLRTLSLSGVAFIFTGFAMYYV